MSNKKNIDRLFQEKFKDFEVAPNDAVWDRINESLPKKKKKRRVIALWLQVGGVAAMLALMLTVGVSVFNSGSNDDVPIVNTKDTDNKDSNIDQFNKSKQDKIQNKDAADQTQFVNSDDDSKIINNGQDSTTLKKDNISNPLINSNKYQQKSNTVTTNSTEKIKRSPSKKQNTILNRTLKNSNATVTANANASNANSNTSEDANSQLRNDKELKSTIKNSVKEDKTGLANNFSSNTNNSDLNTTNTKDKTIEEELKPENAIVNSTEKQTIEDAIAENTIDEKEEEKQNRWSVAPNVAPVYYSSLGNGSSIDQQFNDNAKRGDINMSYGITGSYAVTKKLKIRTGINSVNLSQRTSDVIAFAGAETAARGVDAQFSNIAFDGDTQNVSLISSDVLDRASTPELFDTQLADGELNQNFGFIEVPLELEYRVLDKKFGVNVIGGFSTFFLNQNEVFADINGASTLIGEADNLNATSFSANFGLGMDYSLSKQLNINLEPTFKYQINTFNNTSGDFRPFFIGVYTGLSFKF